jgi:hypothetical protein
VTGRAWTIHVHEDDPQYLSINNGGNDTLLRTSGGSGDNERAAQFAAWVAALAGAGAPGRQDDTCDECAAVNVGPCPHAKKAEAGCVRLRERLGDLEAADETAAMNAANLVKADSELARLRERLALATEALEQADKQTSALHDTLYAQVSDPAVRDALNGEVWTLHGIARGALARLGQETT